MILLNLSLFVLSSVASLLVVVLAFLSCGSQHPAKDTWNLFTGKDFLQ